ncbi:uncharacterized protein [Watersipora subatra]|uniref:uncharacterized protein n=1 Tax=Watersipora subatra TaxID=2589382 RepID=UPI00355BE6C5
MDHDDQLANTEEDNSETDTDSNSSVEDKASSGKTGGYSFLTGQRIAVHTCDTNESSSSDEGESNETESETEGSTELKYKPGFVSKLLNKFSTISYQGSVVGSSVPSSARHNMICNKSSAPNEVTSIISPSQTSSCTSDQSVNLPSPQTSNTNDMVSPNSIISPVDNYDPPALKAQPIRSSEGLPRKTFYRAPNEIILIEGHSGSDGIAASPADDHLEEVRSPTQSPAEKSPEQAEANDYWKSTARVSPRSPSRVSPRSPSTTSPSAEGSTSVQSARERVLHAKAIFEGRVVNSGKKGRKEHGPISSLKLGAKTSTPVTSTSFAPTGKSSKLSEVKVDSDQKVKSSPDIVIITKAQSEALERPVPAASEKAAQTAVKSPVKKYRYSPPSTPQPLFTSIKLKPTKHRLYSANEDDIHLQPEPIVTSRPISKSSVAVVSQKSKATDGNNSKAQVEERLSPRSETLVSHSGSYNLAERSKPTNGISEHKPLANHGALNLHIDEPTPQITDVSKKKIVDESSQATVPRISLSDIPNKPAPTRKTNSPNGQTSFIDSNFSKARVSPSTSISSHSSTSDTTEVNTLESADSDKVKNSVGPTTISPSLNQKADEVFEPIDPNSVKIVVPPPDVKVVENLKEVNELSQGVVKDIDKIATKDIPIPTAQTNFSNRESNDHIPQKTPVAVISPAQTVAEPPSLVTTSKQPPTVQLLSSTNHSISSNKIANKNDSVITTTPVKGPQVNKAKSLADIPAPAAKAPQAARGGGGDTDLQVVLRRMKNKPNSDELPVTNIDEMLGARRGHGTVLDTRKSMGKRKVPEYEKIHEGPTLKFTDTQVVIGNGCLRPVTNTPIKKNLSFNDLDLAKVHEYPSEKIMIQQIAKEAGAVYWDDPAHLQAAADRSVDEPEAEATKSSLRASLTGAPTTLGSLANHKPSHQQEFKFGQKTVAPRSGSPPPQVEVVEDSDSLRIEPAADHDLKSWSSDGTSDILF